MKEVRIGIIGLGMGGVHARHLLEGRVPRGVLAAVCDLNPEQLAKFPEIRHFSEPGAMLASGAVDAVVVATPHYSHPDLTIQVLNQGLHAMVEKPIAVHKAEAQRLLAAARPGGPLLAVMLNQRTDPRYLRIRKMIQDGELGPLQRITWIITNWFRPQAYYDSGGWRGTWTGEGGGVLMNQCPHQLDLLQWLGGMPSAVRAWCQFGKRHRIEVEDEVTAYLEYPNGATGVFVTGTGEAPGVNRLEVAGDLGRITLDGDRFEWVRNDVSAAEFLRTSKDKFTAPPSHVEALAVDGPGGQHAGIMQNFVDAILDGAPLIAPGPEGLASVELANAMLLSSVRDRTVRLPLEAAEVKTMLDELIANAAARRA